MYRSVLGFVLLLRWRYHTLGLVSTRYRLFRLQRVHELLVAGGFLTLVLVLLLLLHEQLILEVLAGCVGLYPGGRQDEGT